MYMVNWRVAHVFEDIESQNNVGWMDTLSETDITLKMGYPKRRFHFPTFHFQGLYYIKDWNRVSLSSVNLAVPRFSTVTVKFSQDDALVNDYLPYDPRICGDATVVSIWGLKFDNILNMINSSLLLGEWWWHHVTFLPRYPKIVHILLSWWNMIILRNDVIVLRGVKTWQPTISFHSPLRIFVCQVKSDISWCSSHPHTIHVW